MAEPRIISSAESRQILKNQLRQAALARHAEELKTAAPAQRQKLRARIEQDVEQEVQKHLDSGKWNSFLHF